MMERFERFLEKLLPLVQFGPLAPHGLHFIRVVCGNEVILIRAEGVRTPECHCLQGEWYHCP